MRDRTKVLQRITDLYEAWHDAEPDGGHDARSAAWRAKLEGFADGPAD